MLSLWDSSQVASWLQSVGFGYYASKFKEHEINGAALILADNAMLRELGVNPVGKRVKILKAIRRLKLDNNIPMDTEGDELMNKLESMYSEELGENMIVNERISTNEFLQLEEALYKRDDTIKDLLQKVMDLTIELKFLRDRMDVISPKGDDDKETKEKEIVKVFAPSQPGNSGSQTYKSLTLTPELSADFVLGYALKALKISEPLSNFSLLLVISQTNEFLLSGDEVPWPIVKALKSLCESFFFKLVEKRKQSVNWNEEKFFHIATVDVKMPPSKDYLAVRKGDVFNILEINAKENICLVEHVGTGSRGYVSKPNVTRELARNFESYDVGVVSNDYTVPVPSQFSVKKGDKVIVVYRLASWSKIRRESFCGWIPNQYLQHVVSGKGEEPTPKQPINIAAPKPVTASSVIENSRPFSGTLSPRPNQPENKSPFQQTYSKLSDSFKYIVDNAASVKDEFSKLSKEEREKFANLSDDEREKIAMAKIGNISSGPSNSYSDVVPIRPKVHSQSSSSSKRLTLSEFDEMINSNNTLPHSAPEVSLQGIPESPIAKSVVDLDPEATYSFNPISPAPIAEDDSVPAPVSNEKDIINENVDPVYSYKELVEMVSQGDPRIDVQRAEKYLSEEDCIKYLSCSKRELSDFPLWRLTQRKKRVNLFPNNK